MIPVQKVSEILAKYVKLMETLKGESVGGFIIIIPPDGVAIEQVLLGSEPDKKNFFKIVADKCAEAQTQGGYGGVTVR